MLKKGWIGSTVGSEGSRPQGEGQSLGRRGNTGLGHGRFGGTLEQGEHRRGGKQQVPTTAAATLDHSVNLTKSRVHKRIVPAWRGQTVSLHHQEKHQC